MKGGEKQKGEGRSERTFLQKRSCREGKENWERKKMENIQIQELTSRGHTFKHYNP